MVLLTQEWRLEPTYVIRLVETLENHPTAILAFSDIELIRLNGTREVRSYTDLDGVEHRVSRGYRVLQQKKSWWIPYRGIFRAVAVDRIGGLRPNHPGADWHWLIHMSLLGKFIRVPDVLYQKIRRNQSLSLTWNYSTLGRIAATLACGTEIYRSHLSLIEKAIFQILVAGTCLHWLWNGVVSRISQLRQ